MKMIDVQNVFFKYPSSENDTIKGICFKVEQGKYLASLVRRVLEKAPCRKY